MRFFSFPYFRAIHYRDFPFLVHDYDSEELSSHVMPLTEHWSTWKLRDITFWRNYNLSKQLVDHRLFTKGNRSVSYLEQWKAFKSKSQQTFVYGNRTSYHTVWFLSLKKVHQVSPMLNVSTNHQYEISIDRTLSNLHLPD